jgi:hypothetical protein|tara:strand:- start:2463 stop:2759 length:297 start_codon:yes stop_codon:yes gene_type:complete
MINRYDNSRIFRDENGTRYLSRIEYPSIPLNDSDIFIRGVYGLTFMNLAHKFYQNKNFWWIIARANQQTESVYTIPDKEYRVPQNITRILQEYEELNR